MINYYDEIKEKLLKNEIYAKVKFYSKERNKVLTYFVVGKLLSEAGKEYGNDIIGKYTEKLVNEVGKKYNRSTLFRMKQFYNIFSNEKVAPMVRQLNWTYCLILIPLKDINVIYYYSKQVILKNLTKKSLIKSREYERLGEETKNKLVTNEELSLPDLVPDPLLIKTEINQEKIIKK